MNSKQKEIAEKIKIILQSKNIVQLSEYIDLKTKIKIRNTNNEEWEVLPNTIINGKLYSPLEISKLSSDRIRDSVKSNTSRKAKTLEYMIMELEKTHGQKYSYISGYTCLEKSCHFKCNICNNTFETKPKYLLMGHGCMKCYLNNCRKK